VWDEKMLENLTTHDIQDVIELFSVTDKCARAVPSTCHQPQRWGKMVSLRRVPLPMEVMATKTRIRRKRRPVATTSR
jgi:hypothetical protein